jgi:AAA ATPase containing von Willebrand factor type A (vWA) domain
LFVISFGGGYAYYTPAATIQVSINPQIELKINRFNRIIECSPLNDDGKIILEDMKIKNKNIDDALILVVEEAKKDNFITDKYNAQGKIISVKISANNSNKTININKFEKYIDQSKINSQFDNNGQKSELKFNEKQDSENNKSKAKEPSNNVNERGTKVNDSIINENKTNNSSEGKSTTNHSSTNSENSSVNPNDTNNSNKDKVNNNKNRDDNKSNNNEKNNSEKHNNEQKK